MDGIIYLYKELKEMNKMGNQIKIYKREIIFSERPFYGHYRYRDIFQLLQTDNFAPKTPVIVGHHPIFLELFIGKFDTEYSLLNNNNSKIYRIKTERRNRETMINEIVKLLSVFTNYFFFSYTNEQSWFTPYENEKGFKRESIWGQQEYIYSGFRDSIKDFSKPENQEVDKVESDKYYKIFSRQELYPISFPNILDNLFEKYYSLNEDEKIAFDSSCKLFYDGLDLFGKKDSLSFAALISSIETLINFENRGEKKNKCKECGQSKNKISEKFINFLSENASSDPDFEKYANKIYEIRSKLLHEGRLLLYGLKYSHKYDKEKAYHEYLDHISMIHVVRICIINWLLKR